MALGEFSHLQSCFILYKARITPVRQGTFAFIAKTLVQQISKCCTSGFRFCQLAEKQLYQFLQTPLLGLKTTSGNYAHRCQSQLDSFVRIGISGGGHRSVGWTAECAARLRLSRDPAVRRARRREHPRPLPAGGARTLQPRRAPHAPAPAHGPAGLSRGRLTHRATRAALHSLGGLPRRPGRRRSPAPGGPAEAAALPPATGHSAAGRAQPAGLRRNPGSRACSPGPLRAQNFPGSRLPAPARAPAAHAPRTSCRLGAGQRSYPGDARSWRAQAHRRAASVAHAPRGRPPEAPVARDVACGGGAQAAAGGVG